MFWVDKYFTGGKEKQEGPTDTSSWNERKRKTKHHLYRRTRPRIETNYGNLMYFSIQGPTESNR